MAFLIKCFVQGCVFNNLYVRPYPEVFRLSDLIEGWQIALQHMHVGDRN
ncbi:peptidyl-prolyl cis-trans isomerase [gut metagenome]|uniref:Peptidyl-prolyl cis-trans isomerase n=1 Tax=gut metagenome TaxID=749906 RepID=J9CPW6_9ZZZZ